LAWEGPEKSLDRCSVVSKGGSRIPLGPIDEGTLISLCYKFAQVKTPEELLGFVQRNGMLAEDGGSTLFELDRATEDLSHIKQKRPPGDPVSWCLTSARLFNELMRFKRHSSRRVAAFYQSHAADHWSLDWDVKVELVPDPEQGIAIRITTDTLFSALLWQFVQLLRSDVDIRECRLCSHWFETGPGTGRRRDAEFCCEEHKIEHFSRARSKGSRKPGPKRKRG
jgi:hypothetical protein